jgi:hypothetical protein
LVEVLNYLKQNQPAAYEQAAMDLFRASERLAQQKEINHDRYEVDLAIWKVESRIELLSARLKMAGRDSPEGESLAAQLRALLEERHDLRVERLAHDRAKLAERLEKIDRQLATMRANRAQNIERDLRRFVDPPRPANKPSPKPKTMKTPRRTEFHSVPNLKTCVDEVVLSLAFIRRVDPRASACGQEEVPIF